MFMSKKRLAAAIALAISAGVSSAKAVTVLDISTVGATGTINNATFTQIDPQTTGTGVIQPFLRVQANGTAAGYNNDNSTPAQQFDEKTGTWTHSLLLSAVPIVGGSYQFLLDINQEKHDPILYLDSLKLFQSAAPLSGFNNVTNDFSSSTTETLRYNLDSNADNQVKMDYSLNPGSGAGDAFIYIPTSFFNNTQPYLTLFASFSNENDGFEEFSVLKAATPVPVPVALWGGMVLLGGMGITKRFRRRNAELA